MCPKRVRRHEWTIAVNLGRPVNLWISLFLTNWCRNIILSQSPVQVSLHTATTFHLSLTKVFFQKSLHVRSALSKATQADRWELTDTENMAGHCVLTVRQSVEITDVSGHCWIVFGQARATVMHAFRTGQGHCNACHKKWGFTDNELCDCGEIQTMSHVVNSCPLTKFDGGLLRLHEADEAAVDWLTTYGS